MLKDLLIIHLGLCRFCGDHVLSVCVQRARASLWGVSLSSVGHTATGEEMGFPVVQRGLSWQSMKATIKPQTASWYWPARWLIITHLPLICSALFTHYSISTPTPPPPPPDPSLLPPFAHRFSFFVWMWQFVCVCVCVFRSENKCGCEKRKSVCVCVCSESYLAWPLNLLSSQKKELCFPLHHNLNTAAVARRKHRLLPASVRSSDTSFSPSVAQNETGAQDLRGDRLVNFLVINTDTRWREPSFTFHA